VLRHDALLRERYGVALQVVGVATRPASHTAPRVSTVWPS
jgi:hypothetical protein